MADMKEMTGCERRKNLDKIWECYCQVHLGKTPIVGMN